MPHRAAVVAFDVVETLMSLEPLRARFTDVGLPGDELDHWFDRLLRDGMALTLAGGYEPFPVVAGSALRSIAGGELDDNAVDHVLAGISALPAQPDAEPAMRLLAEADIVQVCLSNGAAQTTSDFLARTGLDRYIARVISVEDVRQWKPSPDVYTHALRVLERSAEDVALVAVHAFDCHGAGGVGMTTGWSSRREGTFADVFQAPDITGADLVDVARGLIALPRA